MSKQLILKIEQGSEQEYGPVRKILGLLNAKSIAHLIDVADLSANPRSAKTGAVTEDIETSLRESAELFPAKTKGILLASSAYRALERQRYQLTFVDVETEGLLDGGHNALAAGRHILREAGLSERDLKRIRDWDAFSIAWKENRQAISEIEDLLEFHMPVEIQVPVRMSDQGSVDDFKASLLEIGSARNNNVQLTEETKANKQGLYQVIRENLPSTIANRVEWKANDGGDIKVRDIVSLCWIPLSLLDLPDGIRVNPNQIYRNKAICVDAYNKLMKHPDVSTSVESGYEYELINDSIRSAIKIGASLPEIYDLLFEKFPDAYNKSGGSFGKISAVKLYAEDKIGEKNPKYLRTMPRTHFFKKEVHYTCPDGFLIPFLFGMRSLLSVSGDGIISWNVDPHEFIKKNLVTAMKSYRLAIELGNWDPQQVGKKISAYDFAEGAIRTSL
jgi:hypothetical protein